MDIEIYELVTPHGVYSLEAGNFEVAAHVNALVTGCDYALYGETPDNHMPRLTDPAKIHGLADAWFEKQFGKRQAASLARLYTQAPESLLAALDSLTVGNRLDYKEISAQLALLPTERGRKITRFEWCRRKSADLTIPYTAWDIAKQIAQNLDQGVPA